MFFPYEVGIIAQNRAKNDDSLIQIRSSGIPQFMEFYVEKIILNTLNNPLIIDYTELNEIEFPFIPAIPKALQDYNFFLNHTENA
jgi:hypothetical protein